MRRWPWAALLVALVVAALGLATPVGAQEQTDPPVGGIEPEDVASDPGRVLVVSIPGLTWADVEEHDLPNLEALFAEGALADLAPRAVKARATPGAAYLTMSAGARAVGEDVTDGQVLALDDESSGSLAGEIFTRRTGVRAEGPYVSLSWPALLRRNAAQPYDAELGLLAETLAGAGASTSVIGNADGTESIGPSFERQVGLALADTDGVVPDGHLDKDLLVPDVAQPFGLRMDADAVAQRVADAWEAAAPDPGNPGGGVVLVEMSDTARVLRYRSTVDSGRYAELWAEALSSADALFGRMLADLDLDRDTVMVVAPYNRRGDRDLTAIALGGRGVAPGYLRSASTQRAGFLTLVDVAPTILDRLGIARPTAMEGRPAVVVRSTASGPDRIAHLVALNDASRFRERLLTPTTTAVVLLLAVVVALGMLAHTNRWSRRARSVVALLALWDLALLPLSYLARAFPLEELGAGFYWTFILVGGLVAAACALGAQRWLHRPRLALDAVLVVVVGVIVVDVVTGSRLALSSAFGYSATGNSRLYGVSNYSYAQLAAGVCLLAAAVAAARPGRPGRLVAVGMMGATVVLLGVPTLGSDVGGVLAFTPSVLVFWLVLTKRRIRVRTIGLAVATTALAIAVFGFLDLSRPPGDRAHLGRLFERIGDEGLEPLTSIVERKLLANLEVSTSSLWVLAIPLALVLWIYLVRFPTRPYALMRERFATLPAALAAGLVAAVLGSLLNDSGTIVGGVAATVLGAALALLLVQLDPPAVAAGADDARSGDDLAVGCDPVVITAGSPREVLEPTGEGAP